MTGVIARSAARIGPVVAYPESTVGELVLAAAARRPHAPAVVQHARRISYAELVGTAAELAAELVDRGVGPDVRVGICHRRTPDLIVAMLAVMLAGGCYVPIDPDAPAARAGRLIDDADITAVIVDPDGRAAVDRAAGPRRPTLLPVPPTTGGRRPPGCPARPDDPAYVLYTSGSTGRPKGVVMPHRAIVSLAAGWSGLPDPADAGRHDRSNDHRRDPSTDHRRGEAEVSGAFASITFDVSVLDIFPTLIGGGAVALVPDADRVDPHRLHAFVRDHRVTRMVLPTALLPLLDPDDLPDLRLLITGAEAPGPEQVERWSRPGRTFVNAYGPTETCVTSTHFIAEGRWSTPIPIGFPQANHRTHVVDTELNEVPPGTPGELLIGGIGLARGYLGDPATTARQFVPDPFGADPGGRLYRTGDLVRTDPDGRLMFLGRIDRQVKIRGQRVEIGEIEALLDAAETVGQCVIDAVPGPDGIRLDGYLTAAATAGAASSPDPAALLARCADQLPAAMVPARLIVVDELPLNSSGKVDVTLLRRAHPLTGSGSHDAEADTGGSDTGGSGIGRVDGGRADTGSPFGAAVLREWTTLLGAPASGDTDLFAVGGHSVTAMRLVAALRAATGRDVAVEDVFTARTVRGLVEAVERAAPITGDDGRRDAPPTLSPAQRRLWFLDRYAPATTAYNIAMAERLRGPLDPARLRTALAAVARRQQVLRWRIPHTDGIPAAVADVPAEIDVPMADLTSVPDADRESVLADRLAAAARVPFDLAGGPLWRAELYRLQGGTDSEDGSDTEGDSGSSAEHVLAITAHHAVFDGWSQDLLYRDLAAAYAAAGRDLPGALLTPLPAGYGGYTLWRAERAAQRAEQDRQWWAAHLAGAPTSLELPADRPRPPRQTFDGAMGVRLLDAAGSERLSAMAAESAATDSAVLAAALAVLVRRLTGCTDLLIGTPAVDRRHADFQDMIGFFVEIIPLRLQLDDAMTGRQLVATVRDELLAALAHPEITLETVAADLGVAGTADRNPVVQVMFNMFNFPAPELLLPGVRAAPVDVAIPGSPFDLTVHGFVRDGRVGVDMVYDTALFDSERIENLLDAYVSVVRWLVDSPDVPVLTRTLPEEPALVAGVDIGTAAAAAAAGPTVAEIAAPAGPGAPAPGQVAAGSTAAVVAEVWRAVLGEAARFGPDDSFFDVGGSSLAAARVQAGLGSRLGAEPALVELFRFPTIRTLAAHLDGGDSPAGSAADRAAARGAARTAARTTARNAARRRQARQRTQNGPQEGTP